VRANDEQVAAAGESLIFEEVVPQDDGDHTYISVKFPLRDADGAVYGVCGISTDITERQRMEAELRRHQADLAHVLRVHTMGQMAVSLAHEINQPLGAIASYAHGCRNWLASNVYERERVLEAIERIASEALRAGEITRRLRDLLRKGRPRRESASLKSMVENAVGIAQPAAQSAEVALHLDVAGDLPRLTVDPIQIEQVLLNLLLNAIDAAPGAERARAVHVGARREAEGVMVSVSDTGSGIDPEIEQKLFEPFFTTKPNGLGMGLVISRSIVEAHGGRIWVESAVEGGARFCFTLPLSGREE